MEDNYINRFSILNERNLTVDCLMYKNEDESLYIDVIVGDSDHNYMTFRLQEDDIDNLKKFLSLYEKT